MGWEGGLGGGSMPEYLICNGALPCCVAHLRARDAVRLRCVCRGYRDQVRHERPALDLIEVRRRFTTAEAVGVERVLGFRIGGVSIHPRETDISELARCKSVRTLDLGDCDQLRDLSALIRLP